MRTITRLEHRRWLAALRSDNFKQGRQTLYNVLDNAYCCLGVLGRVCDMPVGLQGYLTDAEGNYTILSQHQQSILVFMNDQKRKTFSEIADWVEKNVVPA